MSITVWVFCPTRATSLYWDPDVKTDSTGRAWVSFYNNSSETRLRISAETLSSDGVPGCCE